MKWPLQFAVYGAGDAGANGRFPALQDFLWRQLNALSKTITTQRVAGLVQLDSVDAPSMRSVLDPGGRHPPMYVPDTNTGDPSELIDFCAWADDTCPAERHVLVLSGHGLAFQDGHIRDTYNRGGPKGSIKRAKALFFKPTKIRGILMDESDFLTVPEMRSALAAIARRYESGLIDVVVFDACLMSNVELVYELTGIVGAVVGAVDEISGEGLDLAGAASLLDQSLPQTPADIAAAFPKSYRPLTASDSAIAVSLDTTGVGAAVAAFAEFSTLLLADIGANPNLAPLCRDALANSSRELVAYRSQSLADIGAVYVALRDAGIPAATLAVLESAMQSFARLIVGRSVGAEYENAVGLSLFAPSSIDQYRRDVTDYRALAFARRTQWVQVLERLFDAAAQLARKAA